MKRHLKARENVTVHWVLKHILNEKSLELGFIIYYYLFHSLGAATANAHYSSWPQKLEHKLVRWPWCPFINVGWSGLIKKNGAKLLIAFKINIRCLKLFIKWTGSQWSKYRTGLTSGERGEQQHSAQVGGAWEKTGWLLYEVHYSNQVCQNVVST